MSTDAVKFFVDQMTLATGVVSQEVLANTNNYKLESILPRVVKPVSKVINTILSTYGGSTSDYVLDGQTKSIPTPSYKTVEFSPAYFKEMITVGESTTMFLRNNFQSYAGLDERGITQYVTTLMDYLRKRIEVKMELLRSQALFDGEIEWNGTVYSYGRPSNNIILPVGQSWLISGGPGQPALIPNPNADPIDDIRTWFMGFYNILRKYKFKAMHMNPITAQAILQASSTRTYLTSYAANPSLKEYEVNSTLQFLVPGAPLIEINDSTYLPQAVAPNPDGSLDVGDGEFIIPTGKILFVLDPAYLPMYNQYGEFSLTLNPDNSYSGSAAGPYVIMMDRTNPANRASSGSPAHIELTAGFSGLPNLIRNNDVFIADVLPQP